MSQPSYRSAFTRCLYAIIVVVINQCAFAFALDDLAQEVRPSSWKADASLTDVTFVSRNLGWVVGSQGTLLRTEDGGKTWKEGNLAASTSSTKEVSLTEKLQQIRSKENHAATNHGNSTSFSCRFESVCFTDEENGWAAGGYDIPWLGHSRAAIARTMDGGKSWQPLPYQMIGRIKKIDMQGLSGWSVGASDPGTEASLFFTSDAGNIWNSQKSKRMPDLIDAAAAGNRFVGIDGKGQPLHFDTTKFEYSVFMGSDDDVALTDLVMIDGKKGIAVGENGVVLMTKDAGLSWSVAVESEVLGSFDFRCVHFGHDQVWFAGDPGHVLFSLNQKNGEFKAHVLPGSAAINDIHFVDQEYGWVVGDFGRIYSTIDGGASWKLQRSGSAKGLSYANVMVVCTDSVEIPIELIAKQAGEDGKLVGVVAPKGESSDATRLAAERVGAAVVSAIETGNENELVLLHKIVRTIRSWKPTIIIGDSQSILSKAIRLAADERAFSGQISSGLKPWQAKYVMISDPNGPIQYESNVFLPRTGMLMEDFALPSRMLCNLPVSSGNQNGFFAWKVIGQGRGAQLEEIQKSPFSLTSVAKRTQASIPLGSLSSVGQVSKKREQVNWLLGQKMQSVLDIEECKRRISQFGYQLKATPGGDYIAGVWLTQLADQFIENGQMQQAAFALEEVARSFPEHCLAPLANTTLAKYYSSSEHNQIALSNWETLRGNIGQASRIPAGTKQGAQNVAIAQKKLADGRTEYRWSKVDLASALEEAADLPLDIDVEEELKDFDPATVDLSLDVEEPQNDTITSPGRLNEMSDSEKSVFLNERYRLAANYFSRIGTRDPGLVKRADYLYLQAHIVEQLAGFEQAKAYFQKVYQAKPNRKYSLAASEEMRRGTSKQKSSVVVFDERPHLDGLPNDPIWEQAIKADQRISMGSVNQSAATDTTLFACDEKYLYLYAKCYKSGQRRYVELADQIRKRDEDLSGQHRVEFCIDVDRDLSNTWNVEIDWRGRVRESCGSDKSWNPKMYVARHIDDSSWSIECAIPFKDLAGRFKSGSAWRIGARRVMRHSDRNNLWQPFSIEPFDSPDELVILQANSHQ